jgi:SWI/SNF-related matrix-associated actin-dependent regulator 1 of chromatin subfamily A
MRPYPYQEEGIAFLAARRRAALLDEPGLGKTAQAIEAMSRVGARRTLIIAPLIVVPNWERELAAWAPWASVQRLKAGRDKLGDASVVICPHSLIASRKLHAQLCATRWHCAIVDEAHAFKTPSAQRTQALYSRTSGVAQCCDRLWILTGTLAPNNASEVYSHLSALAPNTLLHNGRPMSYWQFVARYCQVETVNFGRGRGAVQRIVGNRNAEELRGIIESVSLRRRKADVLRDLPASRSAVVPLPAPSQQALRPLREVLGRIADEAQVDLDSLASADLLEVLRNSAEFGTYRRVSGEVKAAAAIDYLRTELDGGLRKVVVFAHHLSVIAALAEGLADYGVEVISGSVPADERQRIVDRFQTDPACRVVVGQLTAASVGVTLTAASDVVFVEASWTPGDNRQAADRVHRIGQNEPVLVRYLAMQDSVDADVMAAIERKTAMISELGMS